MDLCNYIFLEINFFEQRKTYNVMHVKGFTYDLSKLLQGLALGNSYNAFCVLRQSKYWKKERMRRQS